ncbi:Tubulin polyglutamylase ttll6 [Rhizophlyctis rosea]|uniref:Tubulin polyglutamylase ttll6 n=1 Tax=Rhizophlyctis rosea TaxID=64517 RepID=A0AAD5SKB7_9FUNG|nr:Tubulin polyglutamylase ttll6 [Rhizophlyctis rosea]
MYREGLARFATERYREPSTGNSGEVRMHLTNYAINKGSDKFEWAENKGGMGDAAGGSKRRVTDVFRIIEKQKNGKSADVLWNRIGGCVVKTLITIQPQLSRILKACSRTPKTVQDDTPSASQTSPCFEILGFDILLDYKLKPWLLEVNHSPSFTCDSPIDMEIKSGVIADALRILGLDGRMRREYEKQERRRAKSRLVGRSAQDDVRTGDLDGGSPSCIDQLDRNGEHSAMIDQRSISSLSGVSSHAEPTIPPHLTYAPDFSPAYLAALTAQEDLHMGNFVRIFPPPSTTLVASASTRTTTPSTQPLLSHYLHLLEHASTLFTSTLATKARESLLARKKREEEEVLRRQQERNERERERRRKAAAKVLDDESRISRRKEREDRREELERRRRRGLLAGGEERGKEKEVFDTEICFFLEYAVNRIRNTKVISTSSQNVLFLVIFLILIHIDMVVIVN